MFRHITQTWRGWPMGCCELVVGLIGVVTTKEGLVIQLALNENRYETGPKVSDEEMEALPIGRATLHGERNYTLAQRPPNDYG